MAHNYHYFIALMCGIILGSCATTKPGVDRTILEHQQQITELEERNQELERRLAQYDDAVRNAVNDLTDIRTRSIGMEGTIDEVIQLFNEYQRRVDELAQAYNHFTATPKGPD